MRGSDLTDIGWFKPDGAEMSDTDWHVSFAKALGVFLNGAGFQSPDRRGRRIEDDDFLLLFNAGTDDVVFAMPEQLRARDFREVLDTTSDTLDRRDPLERIAELRVGPRSIRVLRAARPRHR